MSAALFAAAITVVLGWMLIPVATAYVQAERNFIGIQEYEALLRAANRISAERGPANTMMSIAAGTDAAAARLTAFRAASDTALGALDAQLSGLLGVSSESTAIAASKAQLLRGRQLVDRVVATPAAARARQDVADAINAMIDAVDELEPLITGKARALAEQEPALAGLTLIAHAVSDLREFAGRLASYVVPAVALREKLKPEEIDAFHNAVGRLTQIDHILHAHGNFAPDGLLGELAQTAQTVYFDGGLALVKTVVAEGRYSGDYSISVEALTDKYVPSLRPLEALRTHYINLMIESVATQRRAAFIKLAIVSTAVVALVTLLAALLHSLRLTVVKPLLTARDAVVAMADERKRTATNITTEIAEIRSLFDSLDVLSVRLDERRALMATLKKQAESDPLTGLPNRSAFEVLARTTMSQARDGRFCIFYIDLDDFKIVNDTHGHHLGDALLKAVASRLWACAGDHAAIARIGGDEFAACCEGLDAEARQTLARSLVDALSTPFHLGNMNLSVSISVGIAALTPRTAGYDELCRQADMALYQAKSAGRNTYREFAG
ncbi:diguanylate cyclase [Pigmentiphaga aceris]|uniref:Diguanylate cyclase n=1 Tax=Pigmentiphaga aceris TaxID=1940612 RepID=A0A5C0B2H2_9BURK|nr:GGDEF domain-containing protein [Pigmentiphaga aceris]QEI08958.1 diguanylate cyclase [Pigmentiphaga aceris]